MLVMRVHLYAFIRIINAMLIIMCIMLTHINRMSLWMCRMCSVWHNNTLLLRQLNHLSKLMDRNDLCQLSHSFFLILIYYPGKS